MSPRLSPQRTVTHQTSICKTSDGPHAALGFGGDGLIYGNILMFACAGHHYGMTFSLTTMED